MEVAEQDRKTLAQLLAERVPSWALRQEIVSAAGITNTQLSGDAQAAWNDVVEEAARQGKLAALFRVAVRVSGGDPALAAALGGLDAGEIVVITGAPGGRRKELGLALVALLALGGLGWAMFSSGDDRPTDTVGSTAEVDLARAAAHAPAADADAAAAQTGAVAAVATDEAATDEAATDAATDAASADAAIADADAHADLHASAAADLAANTPAREAAPAPVELALSAAARPGPCAGREGYAYMGTRKLAQQGEEWQVDGHLNLRSGYPHRENGWNSRTASQCVLPPGTKVRLLEAPIAVDGGAYWVKVSSAAITVP